MTCSGLSGSSPAASTPSDTTSASQPCAAHSRQGRPPPASRRRRFPAASGRLRGPRAVAGSGLVGVPDDVREPAGRRVDVHRAVEHVRPFVEDAGCRCRGGRRCRRRRPVVPGRAQRLRGDRGVVEVAGAAVAAPGDVVARRPAECVGRARPAATRSTAVRATSTAARAASQVPGPISVIVS